MSAAVKVLENALIKQIYELPPEQQFEIAKRIASNVGYKLMEENHQCEVFTKVIRVIENGKNMEIPILIPFANIDHIQKTHKSTSTDSLITLKSKNKNGGSVFFFVKESIDELQAQINEL